MNKKNLHITTLLVFSFAAAQKIKLGEDLKEINAYTKNIYKADGIIYIDIDLVEIKYKNSDERIIVNKNSKLRTYSIDSNTLIYADNCNEINPESLLKRKKIILSKNQ